MSSLLKSNNNFTIFSTTSAINGKRIKKLFLSVSHGSRSITFPISDLRYRGNINEYQAWDFYYQEKYTIQLVLHAEVCVLKLNSNIIRFNFEELLTEQKIFMNDNVVILRYLNFYLLCDLLTLHNN
jgi:hypothetical protein